MSNKSELIGRKGVSVNKPSTRTKTERIARLLAKDKGYDPDALEPGDLPRIDGYMKNGDPAHYMWRQFVPLAKKVIREASYP